MQRRLHTASRSDATDALRVLCFLRIDTLAVSLITLNTACLISLRLPFAPFFQVILGSKQHMTTMNGGGDCFGYTWLGSSCLSSTPQGYLAPSPPGWTRTVVSTLPIPDQNTYYSQPQQPNHYHSNQHRTARVWFTSDQHFGHKKIIDLAGRPFADIRDMDETMIQRYNDVVGSNDTVYFLGDFSFYQRPDAARVFRRLKGNKHLVIGNHDSSDILSLNWVSVSNYKTISHCGRKFILFHYPIEEWEDYFKDSIHLHGHNHQNSVPSYGRKLNRFSVCVDVRDYRPVSADEIIEWCGLTTNTRIYPPSGSLA